MSPRLLLRSLGLASCLAAAASAQTVVPGGNIINQTWTPVGSPYLVMGDITVPAGATLTIQPGVSVQFAPADAQAAGLDPLRVELTVHGSIVAQGTASNPITFTAQGGGPGAWHGIVVGPGATQAAFSRASINLSRRAITSFAGGAAFGLDSVNINSFTISGLDIRDGGPILTDVWLLGAPGASVGIDIGGFSAPGIVRGTISQCATGLRNSSILFNFASGLNISGFGQYGIDTSAGSPLLSNLWISGTQGGSIGVQSVGSGGATLRNAYITSCGLGVRSGTSGATNIQFSTIHGNSGGGIHFFAGTGGVANSIVSGNDVFGIQAGAPAQPTIRTTNVYTPAGQNFIGAACASGCISADPLFAGGNPPLLAPGSPCIDAADPTGPADYFGTPRPHEGNNLPGTFADMGIHELPCYANCDRSTAWPVLNVADFTCFLQGFASGAAYANCDASTQTPALNVADFTCFLQRFAAGCP